MEESHVTKTKESEDVQVQSKVALTAAINVGNVHAEF